MRLPEGWQREEPGWYSCHDESVSIVQEADGWWYLYDWNLGPESPGTRYPSLAAALRGAGGLPTPGGSDGDR